MYTFIRVSRQLDITPVVSTRIQLSKYRLLELLARESGRSLSDELREAIEQHLYAAGQEQKQP
jgi:predicted DNA-binding protein